MYCAWNADKNKQQCQLGLHEFMFDSMTQKTKDSQPKYFEQATTHSQLAMK